MGSMASVQGKTRGQLQGPEEVILLVHGERAPLFESTQLAPMNKSRNANTAAQSKAI